MKKYRMRRMTTAQLDTLLQAELRKDIPDEEVVLPILEILESRECKPQRKRGWIISVAAVAAVLVLLLTAVPKAVGADSLWDVMLHLSDSVLQFFAPGATPNTAESEYIFHTDNPGLQQLYDKVVELGITDPIVPMWLPDGYELTELKEDAFDGGTKISCSFIKDAKSIVTTYKISEDISSTQYEREIGRVEIYERGGIGHAITMNYQQWCSAWVKQGIECHIATDLSREELKKIISSIYGRVKS